MDSPVVGGLLAFAVGCAVAYANYRINLHALRNNPSMLARLSVVRQLLNVGTLAAAYILSDVLPWGAIELLSGAAVGLTVPSILLSVRLAKLNDARAAEGEAKKGENADE